MAPAKPLQGERDYRDTLAEIRRLRTRANTSEEDPELAALEAAAADYAERLRARDLKKGRPKGEGGDGQ